MVHAVQCQSVLFRLFSVRNYNAGFQENANTLPGSNGFFTFVLTNKHFQIDTNKLLASCIRILLKYFTVEIQESKIQFACSLTCSLALSLCLEVTSNMSSHYIRANYIKFVVLLKNRTSNFAKNK
jgi:hypothetical protein